LKSVGPLGSFPSYPFISKRRVYNLSRAFFCIFKTMWCCEFTTATPINVLFWKNKCFDLKGKAASSETCIRVSISQCRKNRAWIYNTDITVDPEFNKAAQKCTSLNRDPLLSYLSTTPIHINSPDPDPYDPAWHGLQTLEFVAPVSVTNITSDSKRMPSILHAKPCAILQRTIKKIKQSLVESLNYFVHKIAKLVWVTSDASPKPEAQTMHRDAYPCSCFANRPLTPAVNMATT
jgi:hypothetical protein